MDYTQLVAKLKSHQARLNLIGARVFRLDEDSKNLVSPLIKEVKDKLKSALEMMEKNEHPGLVLQVVSSYFEEVISLKRTRLPGKAYSRLSGVLSSLQQLLIDREEIEYSLREEAWVSTPSDVTQYR